MLRLASFLGLFLSLFAAAPARAANILFVSDSGADEGIATALEADGHSVQRVLGDFAGGNPTLRGDLSRYDAVFWSASGNGSGDEHSDAYVFSNLTSYVMAGGRVLVTGYDTVASPTDPLLIAFLGASGSTDVPPAPGAISTETTSLTTGRIDIRGIVPSPLSGDRDTLTGLGSDTVEIVGTPNGAGSQWTLRRLGSGEIAYVSNGDGGTTGSSTASWTTQSSDGSGVYNAAIRNFGAAGLPGLPGTASVPRGSPRLARVMSVLASAPAVLVGPDRAWLPIATDAPLSLCAGSTCRPIREVTTCEPPRCPGNGTLVIATDRVANVSDFPTGRVEWNRERDLLAYDPELASLAPYLGTHPEPLPSPGPPPRFLREDEWLQWELRVEAGAAVLPHAGIGVAHFSASAGIHFQPDIDDGLDLMYGTMMGVEAVVHVLPGVSGQRAEDVAILLGLAPAFTYAFPHDRVRIPPLFAWFVPEFGVAMRTDAPLTYYVGWSLSAAALLDDHVGVDVRGRVMIVDDWVAGDDVEAIVSLTLGLLIR